MSTAARAGTGTGTGTGGEEARLAERAADLDALLRARAGDGDAFGQIYDRHAPAIYRAVTFPGAAGNAALAQDLLQETFLKALEALPGLRHPERGAYVWLRAIALNAVRDHWRRVGQEARGARLLAALALDPTGPAAAAPEDALEDAGRVEQLRGRVSRALSGLTDRYRAALTHRFIEGLDGERAAALLGVTRSTLDVIVHRAARAFRKLYGDRSEEP